SLIALELLWAKAALVTRPTQGLERVKDYVDAFISPLIVIRLSSKRTHFAVNATKFRVRKISGCVGNRLRSERLGVVSYASINR
ncbi:MAG: hypothetical protein DMF69_21870, partial [Acidobacteria bacterium]